MIVFLDFEASSLGKKSVPIEVAWVFQDGRARSALIRPEPDWTDWAPEAEAIHGISRSLLLSEGVPVKRIATDMMDTLAGHDLYASAPSWDGKWLSTLLRSAGFPRHSLRLGRSHDAFLAVAHALMDAGSSDAEISALVDEIVEQSRLEAAVAHRAMPDAMLELGRWKRIRDAAAERVESRRV